MQILRLRSPQKPWKPGQTRLYLYEYLSNKRYLIDQRMQEIKTQAKQSKSQRNNQSFEDRIRNNNNNNIQWIERLLQTPIPDYRSSDSLACISTLFDYQAGLSHDEPYAIIHEWLNKCNELEALRFNPRHKIIGSLKDARSFFPLAART